MAKLFTFRCDVCGKVKGETNHWFVLLLMPRKIEVLQFEENWSKPGALHVCGSGCAMKRISERMSSESFAADALQRPQLNGLTHVSELLDEEPVVQLRERLDDLDSRDLDWEVGAR